MNSELVKCINTFLEIENDYLKQISLSLKTNGIAVIDINRFNLSKNDLNFVKKTNWLNEIKKIQLRDFKTENPENGFVLGAFGALGNPASFHNELLYKLRYILFNKIKKAFYYLDKDRKLEMLFDRIAIRRQGTTTSGETFHRDTCSLKKDEDHIYGGWINLDEEITQYFSCVPGTHTCNGKGGFEKISEKDKQYAKQMKTKIEVKPKNIVIFDQNIIHEIFPQKQKKDNIRLYLGWRHTLSDEPLFNSKKDPQYNITEIISKQIVPPLPSGDLPTMYSRQHPGLWRPRLIQFSNEIKDEYTIYNDRFPDNKVIGMKLKYPIKVYEIPDIYKSIYFPSYTYRI